MPIPAVPSEPSAAPDYRERYETLTGASLRQCPASVRSATVATCSSRTRQTGFKRQKTHRQGVSTERPPSSAERFPFLQPQANHPMHIGPASWSGSVQSIFSPPARPRVSPAFAKGMPLRRRVKNALHYAVLRMIVNRCFQKQTSGSRSIQGPVLLCSVFRHRTEFRLHLPVLLSSASQLVDDASRFHSFEEGKRSGLGNSSSPKLGGYEDWD
jgi:hypothetical protein